MMTLIGLYAGRSGAAPKASAGLCSLNRPHFFRANCALWHSCGAEPWPWWLRLLEFTQQQRAKLRQQLVARKTVLLDISEDAPGRIRILREGQAPRVVS